MSRERESIGHICESGADECPENDLDSLASSHEQISQGVPS